MWPILACSVVALAAVLERAVVFLRSAERPERVVERLTDATPVRGPVSAVAVAYYSAREEPQAVLEERVHRSGSEAAARLHRRLGLLSAIAHLTPLMGLFGTVLGMIGVFQALEASGGRAEVNALAGGIWVALLTTAFGIGVAIPTMAAHHLFDGIAERRVAVMYRVLGALNERFGRTVQVEAGSSAEGEEQRYETVHTA